MPGPQLTAELMLNLHTQDVVKDLEKSLTTGTQKAMRDAKRMVSDAFREATVQALTSGKTGDAMRDLHKAGVVEAQQGYLKLQRQIESLDKKALDDKLTTEEKAQMRRLKEESRGMKGVLDDRMRAFKREQDLQRQAAKEQRAGAKDMAAGLEGAAENLRGVFAGGLGGLVGGARGLGERVHGAGEGRIERAQQAGMKPGADPKKVAQMAKMGRTLAKMGAALATLAAVAGALIVLVKLFADLESKVKDMNRALIETAGAADFGLSHAQIVSGGLSDQIDDIRENTTAMNRNFMRFRVTFKEQQQILSEFNRAGFTYARMNEEIKEGTTHLKSFSDATALAITHSRNLGISTSESAQQMGEFTFETGMGLQDIAEQFSVITREAMVAGHATKRFYSTIVEVTSGMAFYGVRIDETAKLLKTFDSLLGEAVGAESFKRLVGQYKDVGAQDRIREIIVKNQEFAQEQFGNAFERQIKSLARTGDKLGLSEDDMRELLQLDEVQMSARLQQLGAGPEQIQSFRRARMVGQAAGGDMGAMARAMPFAGAGFDVAMASQATEVFGGRRIDEVLRDLSAGGAGAAELSTLEQVTGKSLDELEKLSNLFTDMEAAMINMRDIAKTEASERTPEQEKLLMKYAKELGLFIDEQTGDILKGEADDQGKLIKGTEIAVKDALEAVSETTTLGEDQIKDQLTKDQQIATEISKNITGLTEMMEQTTNMILERIYQGVMTIVDWLPGENTQQLRMERARKEAERAKKEAEEADENIERARQQLEEAREGKDPARVSQAEKNLEKAQERLNESTDNLNKAVAQQRASDVVGGEDVHSGRATGVLLEQRGDISKARSKVIENRMGAVLKGLSISPAETAHIVDRFKKEGILPELKGNEEKVREAWEKAVRSGGSFEERRAVFQEEIGKSVMSDEEKLQLQKEANEYLEVIKNELGGGNFLKESGGGFLGSLFKKANDLVIPAGGGKPILTDEKDTLMAFQPGGPVAGAMRGGGGKVEVNIYGGDQKKVYDTVMKVLKATGNA